MAALSALKKKLKTVRATRKLTKALKTVSSIKYAKLTQLYRNFSSYAKEWAFMFKGENPNDDHADVTILFGSNKGFCGGFNNELVNYISTHPNAVNHTDSLAVCGEELYRLIKDKSLTTPCKFSLPDVPLYHDCEELLTFLLSQKKKGQELKVRIVRPFYRNTLMQEPGEELLILHPDSNHLDEESMLLLPDKEVVTTSLILSGFSTMLYRAVLETALGAQAATLMTMRSAYDTADAYCDELNKEIQLQRQSSITADVLETASEQASKGGKDHG